MVLMRVRVVIGLLLASEQIHKANTFAFITHHPTTAIKLKTAAATSHPALLRYNSGPRVSSLCYMY